MCSSKSSIGDGERRRLDHEGKTAPDPGPYREGIPGGAPGQFQPGHGPAAAPDPDPGHRLWHQPGCKARPHRGGAGRCLSGSSAGGGLCGRIRILPAHLPDQHAPGGPCPGTAENRCHPPGAAGFHPAAPSGGWPSPTVALRHGHHHRHDHPELCGNSGGPVVRTADGQPGGGGRGPGDPALVQ